MQTMIIDKKDICRILNPVKVHRDCKEYPEMYKNIVKTMKFLDDADFKYVSKGNLDEEFYACAETLERYVSGIDIYRFNIEYANAQQKRIIIEGKQPPSLTDPDDAVEATKFLFDVFVTFINNTIGGKKLVIR